MAALRALAVAAIRLAGHHGITEAIRGAARAMQHPRTHIVIVERPWVSR